MFLIGCILLVSFSQYTQNTPTEALMRLNSFNPTAMKLVNNSLILLSSFSNGTALHCISENLMDSSLIFYINGSNTYTPVGFFFNSSTIFVIISVYIRNIYEIPLLVRSQSPSLFTQQGLLIEISILGHFHTSSY